MKSIWLSLLTLGAAAALIGGATLATMSDTETSSGNSYEVGVIDLKIADHDEDFGDGVSATWMLPLIVPGADTEGTDKVTAFVSLKTAGSLDPDHLEVAASLAIIESCTPSEPGYVESDTDCATTPAEMAKKLEITVLTYNGDNCLAAGGPMDCYLSDNDGDSAKSLNDLTSAPGLDHLVPPTTLSSGTPFTMELNWRAGTDDNDFQGDTLLADLIFTLSE